MASILVVEDEADILETLRETLDEEGWSNIGSTTGDDALLLIEDGGLQLIVTDINLPGQLDGIGFAHVARQKRPAIPILFISGRIPKLDEARVVKDPVAFLAKPFSLTTFVQHVRTLMGQ